MANDTQINSAKSIKNELVYASINDADVLRSTLEIWDIACDNENNLARMSEKLRDDCAVRRKVSHHDDIEFHPLNYFIG